jgi:hypothetical protein
MYGAAPAASAVVLATLSISSIGYFWLFMAAFTLLTAMGAFSRLLPRGEA